jgi:hypothetical protein
MSKEKLEATFSDFCQLYPLPVLFIDDNIVYAEELYRQSQTYQVELIHFCSLEEGEEFLATEKGKDIRSIILDIRCKKQRKQEVADDSFITAAKDYFAKTLPFLPVVAITAYAKVYNSMGDLYEGVMPVFLKNRDERKMFEYLRNKALDHEKLRIRYNYRDIFETVNKYFPRGGEESLVSCLQDMDSNDTKIMEGTLTGLRKLQEMFYIALHKKNKKMVPEELVFNKRGEPKVDNEGIISRGILMVSRRQQNLILNIFPTKTGCSILFTRDVQGKFISRPRRHHDIRFRHLYMHF